MKMKSLFTLIFSVLISISSFATHIVGGEITVKWISGNNFEVTLNFYRDCAPNNAGFENSVRIGVFDKVTDAAAFTTQPVLPLVDSVSITVGDNCYDPKLCVTKARYVGVVTMPNNPSGYYISWQRCCRNKIINNIVSPDSAGYVFYAEMPDPALHNSSPTFISIPDGYMCLGYANLDSYTAVDLDGDKIVYSFTQPLDCKVCSNTASQLGGAPKQRPFNFVTYGANYSLANPMGDLAQSINPSSGLVSTKPPTQGVYVIGVRAEEYRAGVKIGEIRRDYQYKVLPCTILTIVPSQGFSQCVGVSNTLSITGAHSGSTYIWSPGGQTTSSIVITPTSAGTYTYQVAATATTSLGICIESAVAIIKVNALPSPVVSASGSLCLGQNTTLSATPTGGTAPFTYLWNPGGFTTSAISGSNLSNGTYTVDVTNSEGCFSKATGVINQAAHLVTSVSSTNLLCYKDNNGTATVNVTGGTPGFSYLWNTVPPQTSNKAIGLIAGIYFVLVTDNNNCTSSNTANISQPASAVTVNTSTAGFVCGTIANGSATANPNGGTGSFTYLWSTSPVQTSAVISNLTIGTYSVLVKDVNGCTAKSTATINPSVQPAADFSYVPIISCDGVTIKFTNLSSQASTALWNFGDNSAQSNQLNPAHVFPATGSYSVSLYVTNPPCNDTKLHTVKFNDISSFVFGASNVFSPNNDGFNDCFHPSMTNVSGKSVDTLFHCISLQVFDRWGVIMFESTPVVKCWDGRNAKDNKDANDGVYYYIAKFGNATIKGSVTLARHSK